MLDFVDKIDIYLFITTTLIAIGALAHSIISSRANANRGLINKVSVRVNELEGRENQNRSDIKRLQEKVDGLNLNTEIVAIHNRINEVAETSSEQAGQLKQINNTLSIIQKHLIGR